MRIGPSLILTSRQALAMTPQLQQAIKLLQLSRMELENLINTELVDNPVLDESVESESTTQSMQDVEPVPDKKAEENPQNAEDAPAPIRSFPASRICVRRTRSRRSPMTASTPPCPMSANISPKKSRKKIAPGTVGSMLRYAGCP